MKQKDRVELQDLIKLMQRLRAPDGCPWDREQTADSLTPYIIEEAHEVIEAIASGDPQHVCEELGDLLFQIIFQAQVYDEQGEFDFSDVMAGIFNKMVIRHPHVFADTKAETSEEVRKNWVRIKKETGKDKPKSALGQVPSSLPGLLRGRRITENAAQVGFDWSKTSEVMEKVEEEYQELQAALAHDDPAEIDHELGDMFFALVNLSRFVNVNPEVSLGRAISRFIERFQYIEKSLSESGSSLEDSDIEQMERLWQEAKENL